MRPASAYSAFSWKRIGLSLALLIFLAAVTSPNDASQPTTAQDGHTTPLAQDTQSGAQMIDATDRQGPFSVGGMQYTLLLHQKLLRNQGNATSKTAANSESLAGLQIVDRAGNTAYQETFSYAVDGGHFAKTLAATGSLLSGTAGSALLVRFVQRTTTGGVQSMGARESWQIFGLVGGRLAPFGAVLPLGQGQGVTVNGVVAGVATPNGVTVVPLTSTAEELPIPAWTGNFYAFVPVRIDWTHGEWGEGEQCYQLAEGSLQQQGCVMRVNAQPQTPLGSLISSVQLFAATDGNTYNSENVSVGPQSRVAFVQARAIVRWQYTNGRAECTFAEVWLQVQIDGKEGWVHDEQAFDALGLPHLNPR